MQTSDVTYERDGATLKAYAAWPPADGHLPALVLIPDVRGLTDHYRDVARRFAGEGFFTLAVDLYSREGAPDLPDMPAVFRGSARCPTRACSPTSARRSATSRAGPRCGRRDRHHRLLHGRPVRDHGGVQRARLAACVSWYGMLRYDERDDGSRRARSSSRRSSPAPYLGLFGAEDALIPIADVEELRAILEREHKRFEIVSYPGAGHAFFNDTRPDAYRPAAAPTRCRAPSRSSARTCAFEAERVVKRARRAPLDQRSYAASSACATASSSSASGRGELPSRARRTRNTVDGAKRAVGVLNMWITSPSVFRRIGSTADAAKSASM